MPFTQEEFFAVFAAYNAALWPLPLLTYLLGFAAVGLTVWRSRRATTTILIAIALMWLINGVAYHWTFFAGINPIARGFGILFVIQSLLLFGVSFFSPSFRITAQRDARTVLGLGLAAFAMIVYPVLGGLAGQAYPAVPVFGIAACPTTIFTIGILLMGTWRVAKWLLVIPAVWAAVGGSAAVLLDVPQDFGLIVALLIVVGFAIAVALRADFARHKPNET